MVNRIIAFVMGAVFFWAALARIFPDLFEVRTGSRQMEILREFLWGPRTIWVAVLIGGALLAVYMWTLDDRFSQALKRLDDATRALTTPAKTSPQEIERILKAWIDQLGLTSRRVVEDRENDFHLLVGRRIPLHVVSPKDQPGAVRIGIAVDMSRQWSELKPQLTDSEQSEFIYTLQEKLLMMRVAYQNIQPNFGSIWLEEVVAFSSLTPIEFHQRLLSVQSAAQVISTAFDREDARIKARKSIK